MPILYNYDGIGGDKSTLAQRIQTTMSAARSAEDSKFSKIEDSVESRLREV